MDQFFIYREYGVFEGKGFEFFSGPHLAWLAAMFGFIAVYTVIYCRGNEKRRDNMRKGLALFIILFEIIQQCVNSFLKVPAGVYLPLEVCSFAEYFILADAMWPDNRITKQFIPYAFLPSAFMALIQPTASIYPPLSYYTVHQFVMHAGIVCYIIMRFAADEIRPRYYGIWLALLIVNILIIPVGYIDARLDQNYMFLMSHQGNPVLKAIWDMCGGHPGILYTFGLEVLVAVTMHITYIVLTIVNKIRFGVRKQ